MIRIEGVGGFVKALNRLGSRASNPRPRLVELAEMMVGRARLNAPVETGRLKNSINIVYSDVRRVVAEASAPYAGFVEFGTRPHIIRPRVKRVLRFEVDGRIVYATMVRHPGTSPQPYWRPAFNYVAEKAQALFTQAMMEAV
ncbi:MAG: HK97 gp10 family phage protein [Candidatus Caldarchaeum sp.]